MDQEKESKHFLATLDLKALRVGDGTDGSPVWIGIDAQAQKVYKIYANGMAEGFGDGRLIVFNGLQFVGWGVAKGEQVTNGKHTLLSDDTGCAIFESDPGSRNENPLGL